MREEKKQEGNYEFPLNQRLLDESLKLKEERKLLKERVSKIEKSRDDVSKNVYEKVRGDYTTRLQTINDQLLHKKNDIDKELASLYETRDKIQANLQNHKHALEEIQFRHQLGEYPKEEYSKLSKSEEDKVGRFEQVLSGVNANIRRYEGLFEGAEEVFGAETPVQEGKASVEEPAEEIDEWEEEAKEAQRPQKEEEGNGHPPQQEWLENTNPTVATHPQLTIISGKDNVGKSFPIDAALTIGRSHTNQIVLKDAKVSRQHAEIKQQGEGFVLIDLNSSNGTAVNGHKVHEYILNSNDEVQIGDFVLQFRQ